MKGNLCGWIIGLLTLLVVCLIFAGIVTDPPPANNYTNSVKKNPHENCKYWGRDREYFAGPMVDVYYNYDHPEWGLHTH